MHRYRALTTTQIERLFFTSGNGAIARPAAGGTTTPDKINPRCQHRLKMLYHHGFLDRQEQPQRRSEGSKPLVYFLDQKGAELLTEQRDAEIDWDFADNDVTSPWLAHLMLTNDVRLAITIAAATSGVQLTEWIDDKSLKSPHMKDYVTLDGPQGGSRQVAVVPDGYFVLRTADAIHRHFLEIDRATVTARYSKEGKRDWRHKVQAYLAYYRSGKYQARYGATGIRILTVTTGMRRLAHLKKLTEEAGGRGRFWFATFSDLSVETALAAPIWYMATANEPRSLLY